MGRRPPVSSVDANQSSHDFRITEWTWPGGSFIPVNGPFANYNDPPVMAAEGVDIRNWLDLIIFAGQNPKYGGMKVNDYLIIRPWRYYSRTRGGSFDQGGQWIADVTFHLGLYSSSLTPTAHRQFFVLDSLNADKIYFQVVSYEGAGAAVASVNADEILGSLYGRTPRNVEGQAYLPRNPCDCNYGDRYQDGAQTVSPAEVVLDLTPLVVAQGTSEEVALDISTVFAPLTGVFAKHLSFQLGAQAGTLADLSITIEASLFPAGFGAYQDVTMSGYLLNDNSLDNVSFDVASTKTIDFLIDYDEIRFKAIKVIATAAAAPGSTAGAVTVRTILRSM